MGNNNSRNWRLSRAIDALSLRVKNGALLAATDPAALLEAVGDRIAALESRLAEVEAECDALKVTRSARSRRQEEAERDRDYWRNSYDGQQKISAAELVRREYAEARLARIGHAVEGFVDAVESAERAIAARGAGGQQAPFHGDFASAPPSTMGRLRWWARAMTEALALPGAEGREGEP